MRSDFRLYEIEIVPDGYTARVNCLWGASIGNAVREVFRVMRSGTFRFQKYVIHHNDAPVVTVTKGTSERRAVDYLYKKVVGCGEEQFKHQVEEYLAAR
jgi:hypothetical protein